VLGPVHCCWGFGAGGEVSFGFSFFIVRFYELIGYRAYSLFQVMVREWVCVGSLTVVFFLRELCFGFIIAPCAFPRWTGHVG
jgi:hypothetical protein